jgi:hypothetical protein
MLVAFPPDVRAWIKAKADLNLATMNSIVVATLRQGMDRESQEKRGTVRD